MKTKLIKPGQARALAYALRQVRCPSCNRHGSLTADRQLFATCSHCGVDSSIIGLQVIFKLGEHRWSCDVRVQLKGQGQ